MSKNNITRRDLLKTGAAVGAGLAAPMIFVRSATAAGYTNAPTGATVTFGFNVPQTGAYADEGADELGSHGHALRAPPFPKRLLGLSGRFDSPGHDSRERIDDGLTARFGIDAARWVNQSKELRRRGLCATVVEAGTVTIVADDQPPNPKPGQTVVALVDPSHIDSTESDSA